MNNQRKFILLSAAVGIVSTFLPWASVSAGAFGMSMSQSTSGFHGVGVLYFILLAGVAVIAIMGDQREMLQKNMRLAVIGSGIVALICLISEYFNLKDAFNAGMGLVNTSIGFGLILSFLATLAVIIIPFIIKQEGESLANDLEQLKSSVKTMQGNLATASSAPASKESDKMAELEKLITWRNEGKISEEEYQDLKSKIV